MEADEPLGPLGRGRLLDHRKRRGVGREHGAVLDDLVKRAPHVDLQLEVLGDRLDREVAVGEVDVVERSGDAPAHGVGLGLLDAALLDRAGELLLDAPDALVEAILVDLAQDYLIAGLGGDLRDAVPHQTRSEHAHLRDLH